MVTYYIRGNYCLDTYYTVCPGSNYPIYIVTYYIKWGNYFLDTRYAFEIMNIKTLHIRAKYLGVDPEVEPGDNDEHAGRHVDGQHVVRELPLQGQHHDQTAVLSY